MNVTVTGKQIDIGVALRQHVETALTALVGKYFDKPMEAHAVFAREAHAWRCDISVHVGRAILLQSHNLGEDAYIACDGALDRIGKRLRRYKRRLRDHHARAAEPGLPATSYIVAPDSMDGAGDGADGAGGEPVIIAELDTEIPTLSVSEAVMRMDLAELPSFLFRNGAHGGLNVVYRRTDGNIGWIDPKVTGTERRR